jgi:hypothetical protein
MPKLFQLLLRMEKAHASVPPYHGQTRGRRYACQLMLAR